MNYKSVIRNALHVTSMTKNLTPPFMMREAGIMVYDIHKIKVENPTFKDHYIYLQYTGLIIPLQLWGVFSYFSTSKPTSEDMTDSEEVYLLTTRRWNPHDKEYSSKEESMIDWEGNLIDKKDRQYFLLSDIEEYATIAVTTKIFSIYMRAVETLIDAAHQYDERPMPVFTPTPR